MKIEGEIDGAFGRSPIWKKWIIHLFPWAAIFGIGGAIYGYDPALRSLANGWLQAIQPVWAPYESGAPLIRAFFEKLFEDPVRGSALFLIKLAAFNTLPIPLLAGGNCIAALFHPQPGGSTRAVTILQLVGLLCFLALAVGWILALSDFFLSVA